MCKGLEHEKNCSICMVHELIDWEWFFKNYRKFRKRGLASYIFHYFALHKRFYMVSYHSFFSEIFIFRVINLKF